MLENSQEFSRWAQTQQWFIHGLSLQFIKFRYKSESTKERNKVNIHAETMISSTLKTPSLFYTDFEQLYEALDLDFKSLKLA